MEENLILDITDIQIIVHKTEEANFRFFNKKRSFDGFIMVTKGNGFVTDNNGERHKLTQGDMLIVFKGDKYLVEFEEPSSYVTSALTLVCDREKLPVIYRCNKKQYEEILNICKIWQSRSWDSYARCRIYLMNFYLDIIAGEAVKENVDKDILKAITFIHKNFKRNFEGGEISEYCSLSLSYLRAKFLKQTGLTIVKYRDTLRIAAAKEMLESRIFTIKEISRELGYCDVYHFSKAFSAAVGISPSKWEEKAKK